MASGTLDANDEFIGPIEVRSGEALEVCVASTGTITVTPYRKIGVSGFVAMTSASLDFTGSYTATFDRPGTYKLQASAVSGGSAIVDAVRI